MTHEEFLASRRSSNFKADYTPEENEYWMEAQKRAAERNASGRTFPSFLMSVLKLSQIELDKVKEKV